MEQEGTSWPSHPDQENPGRTSDAGGEICDLGYPRLPPGGCCQIPGGAGVVLGRGGVDPALGGGHPEPEPGLLDEALVALAVLATRLRVEQARTTRLEAAVDQLDGHLGLLEERMDGMAVALQAALRGEA